MKRILSGPMIAMCIVAFAVAADLPGAAPESQKEKIEAGVKYSMDLNGRFHIMHGKVLGMDCKSCHVDSPGKDLFIVRGDRKPSPAQPGHIHKSRCLGCHREGGTATGLYGTVTK